MLRLAVVTALLGLATATRGSGASQLTQCVHKCEQKNECHASLDTYSCEVSCEALCKCSAISHRMLNKPKHCLASMIEKHQKNLSMLRMKKATIKKVVLNDEDAKPAKSDENQFSSYVPLEEFWPEGERGEAQKPRMLNSHKEMALLRSKAAPWSAAAHHGHHRHHRHVTALVAKNASTPAKNASTPAKNASKPVEAKAAPKATPKSELAQVTAPAKVAAPAKTASTVKPAMVAKAEAPAKETAKVATPVKVTAPVKEAAPTKTTAPAKKK